MGGICQKFSPFPFSRAKTMHALPAAAVAPARPLSFDQLMIDLGFDCAPFSPLVEQGEYDYDEDNLEE
jgi:hypothetical protein